MVNLIKVINVRSENQNIAILLKTAVLIFKKHDYTCYISLIQQFNKQYCVTYCLDTIAV